MHPCRLVAQRGTAMTDYSNGNKPTLLDLEGAPPSSEPAKPKAAGKADGGVPSFDRASMVNLTDGLHIAWPAAVCCTPQAKSRSAQEFWWGFRVIPECTHNIANCQSAIQPQPEVSRPEAGSAWAAVRRIYASSHWVHLQVGTVLESYEDPDIPFLWFHSFGEAFVRPWPALCLHWSPAQCTCAVPVNVTNKEALCCHWRCKGMHQQPSARCAEEGMALQRWFTEWAIPGLGMFCEVRIWTRNLLLWSATGLHQAAQAVVHYENCCMPTRQS